MIEWLAALLALLKSTPEILGVLFELKKMWDSYLDQDQKKQAMAKLQEALNVARTTKDTTALSNLVNSILVSGRVPDNTTTPPK